MSHEFENPHYLRIAKFGDPILTSQSKEMSLEEISKSTKLTQEMRNLIQRHSYKGLAAPQVFFPYRLFIMAPYRGAFYETSRRDSTVVINPQIIQVSRNTDLSKESCVSVPGFTGLVTRSETVWVEYTLPPGKIIRDKFSGFLSKVFQHEFDHLNGILFLSKAFDVHRI